MDIYLTREYGKLYEKIEGGTLEVYEYACPFGRVRSTFIMRPIPDAEGYFDIVTPYGYGGPVMTGCTDKEELAKRYIRDFGVYCGKRHIVSEFIRFHPVLKNADDFRDVYPVEFNRQTLGTNLKAKPDPVTAEFSAKCRKIIRKALKEGVTFRVIEKPQSMESFLKIYYSTMDRNRAFEYYYFDKSYFDALLEAFGDRMVMAQAVYCEHVIAEELCFLSDNVIHIHLSGTLGCYMHLCPSYVLKYGIVQWGAERGFDLLFFGGGRTAWPDDNLFEYKKKFAQQTAFDFYVGKKIWDEEKYSELCRIKGTAQNSGYFPPYREQ